MKITHRLGGGEHLHAVHRGVRKGVQHRVDEGRQHLAALAVGHEIDAVPVVEGAVVLITEHADDRQAAASRSPDARPSLHLAAHRPDRPANESTGV